jgi:primosomal replication protein N
VDNRLTITASISEAKPLRYTPAGLPALDFRLEHASRAAEAGLEREVKAEIRAVAIGALADRLAGHEIGSLWRFTGFIATPRNGRSVVFHVQDFQQI